MSEPTEWLADRVENLSFWLDRLAKRLSTIADAIAVWGRKKA